MAIALDAVGGTNIETTNTGAASYQHVCTGTDLYLFVSVTYRISTFANLAMSYNGVPMAELYSTPGNGGLFVRTFGLVAPATGSNTVSITWTAETSELAAFNSISFTGVDQVAPLGAWQNATGSGTAAPLSYTPTGANKMIASFFGHRNASVAAPTTTGDIVVQNTVQGLLTANPPNGCWSGLGNYAAPSTAAVDCGWALSGGVSSNWGNHAVELNQAQVIHEGSGASTFLMSATGGGVTLTGMTLTQETADLIVQVLTDQLDVGSPAPGYVEVFDGVSLLASVTLNIPAFNVLVGQNTSELNTTPIPEDPSAGADGSPNTWVFLNGLNAEVFRVIDDITGPSQIFAGQPVRITSYLLTWPLT